MLYIVATPIGNLSDLSERAIESLRQAEYIACEDTRHSQRMLDKLGVKAKLISFHAHSTDARLQELLQLLEKGARVALISDAGTPNVSDPGGMLVEEAHKRGLAVSPIPGPSSVTAALSVCGFFADQFVFMGYLPKKKGKQTMLRTIDGEKRTTVFFESPMRIKRTVLELHDIINAERRVCVCRELTKQFEEIWFGTVGEVAQKDWREQGEYVVVVEGSK